MAAMRCVNARLPLSIARPCVILGPRHSNGAFGFSPRFMDSAPVAYTSMKQRSLVVQAASVPPPSAGTWQERNLSGWASKRLEELLLSIEPITFEEGSASLIKVVRCVGDAAALTIRGKRRVDYSFEILLDFEGKMGNEEDSEIFGTLEVEACCGEINDLQPDIKLNGAPNSYRDWLRHQITSFVPKIQDKLLCFEEELHSMSLRN